MLAVPRSTERTVKAGKRKSGSHYNYDIYNSMACFLLHLGLQRTNAMKCLLMQMLTTTGILITMNSQRS